MGLLGGHHLVNNEIFTVGVKEYGITVGDVHPVAFLRGIEAFDIPMRTRVIHKTVDMFGNYATVLLMKALKISFNSLGNAYIQKKSLRKTELLLRPVPRNGRFSSVNGVEVGNKLPPLMLADQQRDRFVEGFPRATQVREGCPRGWR
jgi:hypothetical protein